MPSAYMQSTSPVEIKIVLEAPLELEFKEDDFLLVIRPLHGIPESVLHWFLTFQDHHITNINMYPRTVPLVQ